MDLDDADLGTPGASARREHARRKANRERRTREQHRWIGGLLLALRNEPQDELVWGRGARGEEVVAIELARYVNSDVIVLHDRRVPGRRTNIDHIAIAPSGVWVIDTKRYKGKVAVSRPLFGSPKLTIAGRDQSKLCAGLAKQVALVGPAVAEVAPAAPVRGAMCFVDADLPLRTLTFDDLPMLYPKRLAKRINAVGPLTADVRGLLRTALVARFPPA